MENIWKYWDFRRRPNILHYIEDIGKYWEILGNIAESVHIARTRKYVFLYCKILGNIAKSVRDGKPRKYLIYLEILGNIEKSVGTGRAKSI